MKRAIAILICTLSPWLCRAQTTDFFTVAVNNAGHEMIECAAYYGVMSQGLRNSPGEKFQETAEVYERTMTTAIGLALTYAEEIKQKPEAVEARLDIAIKDMMGTIDNNYVNSSILMAKYAEPCQTVLNDPAARLQHWMDEAERRAKE